MQKTSKTASFRFELRPKIASFSSRAPTTERSPRSASLRPPVTRKTKEQQSSPSSPTKLPTSSEIVPRKKNTQPHTTLFTHSFIHHRLVLIGLRLLSARFLLLHLPLLPCALLAQKRAEERRIHIINHFVHTTTQNNLSLSLSPFFTAKSRSNQLPFALKLADTRNTQNLANSSTAQSS